MVEADRTILDKYEKLDGNPPSYKTEHYIVEADPRYILKAVGWAEHIESGVYPVMLKMLGYTPAINLHILHFVGHKSSNGARAWFTGIEQFRDTKHWGSGIYIFERKLDKMPPYQTTGGITWETIHGLLYAAKEKAEWALSNKGELLDYVFEMELCSRLQDDNCCKRIELDCNQKRGYYPVFIKFWKDYGWKPFRSLIYALDNDQSFPVPLNESTFVYHMSLAVKRDVSCFFEKFGWKITQEVKEKIKSI